MPAGVPLVVALAMPLITSSVACSDVVSRHRYVTVHCDCEDDMCALEVGRLWAVHNKLHTQLTPHNHVDMVLVGLSYLSCPGISLPSQPSRPSFHL